MGGDDAGELRQGFTRRHSQVVLGGIKQYIGDVNFQPAWRIRCGQNAAELLKQIRAKLLLFALRPGCFVLRSDCGFLGLSGSLLLLLRSSLGILASRVGFCASSSFLLGLFLGLLPGGLLLLLSGGRVRSLCLRLSYTLSLSGLLRGNLLVFNPLDGDSSRIGCVLHGIASTLDYLLLIAFASQNGFCFGQGFLRLVESIGSVLAGARALCNLHSVPRFLKLDGHLGLGIRLAGSSDVISVLTASQ